MESKSKMGTVALNIDKILASISSATTDDRLKMRSNAESWLILENKMQRQAAEQLINALDAHEQNEYNALISELRGLDTAQRVIRAFTALPMSELDL
jgi:outer membrane lipopolysaccharide assembly protein LptE/RlpB